MDAVINDEIANKRLPGAVVLVGSQRPRCLAEGYGARALEPTREAMTPDTIFDLASLTKVVATATSIMILVERGKLRLSDPVSLYIPELKGEGRDRITIEQLLTHVSGYAPDFDLRERWTGYDEAIKRLIKEPLRNPPGTASPTATSVSSRSAKSSRALAECRSISLRKRTSFDHCTCQHRLSSRCGLRSQDRADGKTSRSTELSRRQPLLTPERRRGVAARRSPRSNFVSHERRRRTRRPVFHRKRSRYLLPDDSERRIVRRRAILAPLTVAEMTRPRLVVNSGGTRGLGWDINTSFSTIAAISFRSVRLVTPVSPARRCGSIRRARCLSCF
jgi:hypothetical protein